MSITCPNCGAAIAPDSTFCSACGASITPAVQAVPPAPVPPVPVPPPVYAQPVPAAGNVKGGSALKIILIIVGVFVLLGVIVVGAVGVVAWRIAHSVNVNGKDGGVSINTPNGTISTGSNASISEADLGIAIYPGAKPTDNASVSFKTSQGSMATVVFTTKDPASKVAAFYKEKMGENAATMETGKAIILTSPDSEAKDKFVITITSDDEHVGETKIGIVHTQKK